MFQLVIIRNDTKEYLHRRYSYSQTSWTKNLQEAQVFSKIGVRKAIEALNEDCYIGSVKIHTTFAAIEIEIVKR